MEAVDLAENDSLSSFKSLLDWNNETLNTSLDFINRSYSTDTMEGMASSGSSGSGHKVPEPPLYIIICVTIWYVVIFILGIAGNTLVILVIWKNPDMKNSTNFFLVNLSVADLMVVLVCMPSAFVDLYTKEVWILGPVMCAIVPYLENVAALSSMFTILAISFERYHAICHPLKAQFTCTFRRMLKVVTTVWIISLTFCIPFIFLTVFKDSTLVDGTPIKVCRVYASQFWQKVFLIWTTLALFLIILIILLVIYSIIACNLTQDFTQLTGTADRASQAHLRERKQVVVMLFTVILIFFLCLLPIRVVTIWLMFAGNEQLAKLGFQGYLNLIYFSRVMLYLNSILNPIVYNMLSTKFRNAFKRILKIKKGRPKGAFSVSFNSTSQTRETKT